MFPTYCTWTLDGDADHWYTTRRKNMQKPRRIWRALMCTKYFFILHVPFTGGLRPYKFHLTSPHLTSLGTATGFPLTLPTRVVHVSSCVPLQIVPAGSAEMVFACFRHLPPSCVAMCASQGNGNIPPAKLTLSIASHRACASNFWTLTWCQP